MIRNIACLLCGFLLVSCNTSSPEWQPLIINNSLEGWHMFQDDGNKGGWIVENNILIFNGVSDMETGAGDASLLSNKIYRNFEIKLEWKLESGGNSGFMWGVREDEKYNYPYQTGPEIQMLDAAIYDDPESVQGGEIELNNILVDLEARKHFVGALYDLSPPTKMDVSKSADQWNEYHIKIDHDANLGEVTFNGELVNSFPLKGPKWNAMIAKSKFSQSESAGAEYLGDARWYDFGKFAEGHICLQDHPGKASFRNIMIKELD